MNHTVYDTAGGAPAMRALAHAWHRRCLQDDLTAHPFSHPDQHPQHLERLAAYWGEQLGGPPTYTATMADHTHVMRLHSGNGEHPELDERAQTCFALALDDAGIPADERLRTNLKDWFRWATDLMAAHPHSPDDVPDDLELPKWHWNGPVATT